MEEKVLKDIYFEEKYRPIWDNVIIAALQEGFISHAQVQKEITSYICSAVLIDKVIEYGYFDKNQKAIITVEQFQNIISNRHKNISEYRRKLMSYSKTTMEKISNIVVSEEMLVIVHKIIMDSKTEQEVLEKIKPFEKVN